MEEGFQDFTTQQFKNYEDIEKFELKIPELTNTYSELELFSQLLCRIPVSEFRDVFASSMFKISRPLPPPGFYFVGDVISEYKSNEKGKNSKKKQLGNIWAIAQRGDISPGFPLLSPAVSWELVTSLNAGSILNPINWFGSKDVKLWRAKAEEGYYAIGLVASPNPPTHDIPFMCVHGSVINDENIKYKSTPTISTAKLPYSLWELTFAPPRNPQTPLPLFDDDDDDGDEDEDDDDCNENNTPNIQTGNAIQGSNAENGGGQKGKKDLGITIIENYVNQNNTTTNNNNTTSQNVGRELMNSLKLQSSSSLSLSFDRSMYLTNQVFWVGVNNQPPSNQPFCLSSQIPIVRWKK